MHARHLKYPLLSLLLCALLAHAGPLDEAARLIEETNMERLHAQQTRPGVSIDEFHSDGCSGGLSDSWKTLARVWPELSHAIGEQPPWEACCIDHDRAYWRGESIDGFEKRLQADSRLHQCVEQSGEQQAEQIARRLGVPRAEIDEIIRLTAELMFQAVRLGGGPCTGLDWRWGHGWPPCGSDAEPAVEDPGLLQVRQTAQQFSRHRG